MSDEGIIGMNGPLPREFPEMFPDAPLIERPGEVNAWDNPDFRAAVEKANKTQIIVAGILTDVCKFLLPAIILRSPQTYVDATSPPKDLFVKCIY
jgi:hypothetical protein